MGVEADELGARLADAIRNISTMISGGAGCTEVAAATVQCAATMLPGARAIAFEVSATRNTVRILAAANAPFLNTNEELSLSEHEILNRVITEPSRVHHETSSDGSHVFSASVGSADEPEEVIAYKAAPRAGADSMVLVIVSDRETAARADGVLMTLSELLAVLCAGHAATVQQGKSEVDIVRAKLEWERTADALPEVVCLVDQEGRIVRANKTVERWGLGDVRNVRGTDVHALFHGDCKRAACPFKDAVSLSMAAQSSNGYLESAITDVVLGRTLIVHTRLMDGSAEFPMQSATPSAVVVVSDISVLEKARQELSTLNHELEGRVRKRTVELEETNRDLGEEVLRRRGAEFELQSSRDELAVLSQQLIDAQEDERRRISRELHDSLGQSLGAIKYSLERVMAMHENADFGDPAKEIVGIISSLGVAITETRSLAVSLRPPVLDDLGAASAITWLCQHFSDTYSDVAFHIEIDAENHEIPDSLSTAVYRIVQEALNNVVKHAGAETVMVALRLSGNELSLEVLDDGVGFNNSADATGNFKRLGRIGRLGMRERAINSSGTLEIKSWPGEGTRVTAKWALNDARSRTEQEL
jgi:signal transduction histidine kinase/PAS domain-containing protein